MDRSNNLQRSMALTHSVCNELMSKIILWKICKSDMRNDAITSIKNTYYSLEIGGWVKHTCIHLYTIYKCIRCKIEPRCCGIIESVILENPIGEQVTYSLAQGLPASDSILFTSTYRHTLTLTLYNVDFFLLYIISTPTPTPTRTLKGSRSFRTGSIWSALFDALHYVFYGVLQRLC